jgi:hypothetical protein
VVRRGNGPPDGINRPGGRGEAMKRKVLLLLVCLGLVGVNCRAELTYKELMHTYVKAAPENTSLQDYYLMGLYEGVKATNMASLMQNKRPLYCKPPAFELNPNDIKSIIQNAHETFDASGTVPVSYLLFVGLVQTFPCIIEPN